MPEKLKKLFLTNWGLKVSALLLAILVWAMISGREKTYSERTMKVPIEIANLSPNLEVVNLQPEDVRLSLRGTANLVSTIRPENLAIKIDLKSIGESSKLNYFAEDYLEVPRGIQIISIHPKMIAVYVEEFDTKELPVKIRFRGQLKEPLKLKEARAVPDRVTIIGYKSQLSGINVVLTEEINLDEIEVSQKRTVALKQTRNILKFRDRRDVEVLLEIEGSLAANKK
ncbi:MAG: CdaR family protein [Candidatus Aminicenantes bacterium]|nr:CdaR family protein [Candidatus Aminicenantes bacterium]